MKNDLTCAVVRDLLPSYVENLAAAETVQAVERHLAACPDCAARHAAMVDPELAAKLEEERRELDYLKRVKRRSRFRILAAVVCTVLVIAGGFAAKIFLIGTPIQSQTYALRHYVDEENVLHLITAGTSNGGRTALWRSSAGPSQSPRSIRRGGAA